MKKRIVTKINNQHYSPWKGVDMYEMNITVNDGGFLHDVDVILMQEDVTNIRQLGYYYC